MRFKINKKEYELKYSFRALRVIEKDLGLKFSEFDKADLGSLEVVLKIFRAGLLHENKDITLDQAEELLDEHGFSNEFFMEVIEKFIKDTTDSYQKKDNKKKIKNE